MPRIEAGFISVPTTVPMRARGRAKALATAAFEAAADLLPLFGGDIGEIGRPAIAMAFKGGTIGSDEVIDATLISAVVVTTGFPMVYGDRPMTGEHDAVPLLPIGLPEKEPFQKPAATVLPGSAAFVYG